MEQVITFTRHLICQCIRGYQWLISPWLGNCCRFYPSCSEYALLAIKNYGVLRGGCLTGYRLLRCHPWCQGGYDPILLDKETRENDGY